MSKSISRAQNAAFAVAAVMSDLIHHGAVRSGTLHHEQLAHAAAQRGRELDPSNPFVPFGYVRDMTAAGSSGSNYLAQTSVGTAADALRPHLAPLRAGAQWMEGLTAALTIPRESASATTYWLTNEAASITESQPTIGQLSLTAKHLGAYTEVSRALTLQSEQVEPFMRRSFTGTLGFAFEQAIVAGAGSSGAPLGIVNASGVGSVSGSNLAWAGIVEMLRLVEVAGTQPTAWLAAPDVAKLLRNRERASGSGMILADGTIAGVPAHVSSAVPSGTLIAGDFRQLVCALWGDGFSFQANPFQNFATGIVSVRMLAAVDCGLVHPAAFCKAESVT